MSEKYYYYITEDQFDNFLDVIMAKNIRQARKDVIKYRSHKKGSFSIRRAYENELETLKRKLTQELKQMNEEICRKLANIERYI